MDVIDSSVCKVMYFKGDLQFLKIPEPKPRTKTPKQNKRLNNKQAQNRFNHFELPYIIKEL